MGKAQIFLCFWSQRSDCCCLRGVTTQSAASACRHVTFCHHNKDDWREVCSSNTEMSRRLCVHTKTAKCTFSHYLSFLKASSVVEITITNIFFYYCYYYYFGFIFWIPRQHLTESNHITSDRRRNVNSCSLTLFCCSVVQLSSCCQSETLTTSRRTVK